MLLDGDHAWTTQSRSMHATSMHATHACSTACVVVVVVVDTSHV